MYEIVKSVILSELYELSDMLKKIDVIWLQGNLTDEQKAELVKLAQEKAKPENSYAPLREQIENLYEITNTLQTEVKTLSDKVTKLEGGEVKPEPDVEYPEYKQPTGSHDAYYKDDKVMFKGKRYVCIAPDDYAVVWNPEEYPAYWQEVK